MTYLTVSNGYAPGGVSQVPTNILVLDAAGVATGGLLRDIYNTNPAARRSAVPAGPRRGNRRQLRDRHEGRLGRRPAAHEPHGVHDRLAQHGRHDVRRDGLVGPRSAATAIAESDGAVLRARCDTTNTYEVNYFPNLLNAGVLEAEASGIEFELTWLGGENFQLGFNTGLLDTEFVELGQAGEGTVPAFDEGDGFPGAPDMTANLWGQYDWQLANGRAALGAPRLHVDGRLHDVRGRAAAANAGGVRLAERAARVRHRHELVGARRRHQSHRRVLQPGVLLHRVAATLGRQRRPAARGVFRPELLVQLAEGVRHGVRHCA